MGATDTNTNPITFAAFAALAADVTAELFAERATTWRMIDAKRAEGQELTAQTYVTDLELIALAMRQVDSLVDEYSSDASLPLSDALVELAEFAQHGCKTRAAIGAAILANAEADVARIAPAPMRRDGLAYVPSVGTVLNAER